jgi:hypothetical protein
LPQFCWLTHSWLVAQGAASPHGDGGPASTALPLEPHPTIAGTASAPSETSETRKPADAPQLEDRVRIAPMLTRSVEANAFALAGIPAGCMTYVVFSRTGWSRWTAVASLASAAVLALAGCRGDAATPSTGTGGESARGGASGASGTGSVNATGGTSGGAGTSGAAGTSGSAGSGVAGSARAGAGGGLAGASGAGGTSGTSGTSGSFGRGGSGGIAGAGGATGSGGGAATPPYKGVANSPCAARQLLGVTWYYNWTQSESEPCSSGGGQFVPMIWGHPGNEQSASGIASSITSFVNKGYGFVLGFNEPDNSGQSNIPVATAISLWPSFDNAGIEIGTPGTAANANPGMAWYTSFMNTLNADTALRADFMAIHWYGWNAGSCNATASELESYIKWAEGFAGNRPIWITEFGCLNNSAPDVQTVVTFFNGAVAMFAKHPRLVRYAWYPWATNHALVDSNGALTTLGTAFAAAPAYK